MKLNVVVCKRVRELRDGVGLGVAQGLVNTIDRLIAGK